MFICPVCGNLLQKEEKAYICPKGHNYDLAREGYVYLLPPNKKHSKDPGDNKQMVAARRAFLETGLYQPFSDELDRLGAGVPWEKRAARCAGRRMRRRLLHRPVGAGARGTGAGVWV